MAILSNLNIVLSTSYCLGVVGTLKSHRQNPLRCVWLLKGHRDVQLHTCVKRNCVSKLLWPIVNKKYILLSVLYLFKDKVMNGINDPQNATTSLTKPLCMNTIRQTIFLLIVSKKFYCFWTCFWLLYSLGQMVLLNSQLEGSGPEGKRACPSLAPRWSPPPQFLQAALAFLVKTQKKEVCQKHDVLNPFYASVSNTTQHWPLCYTYLG